MRGPDYEILPFIETCLVLQSMFLNVLWIILMMGWLAARDRHSTRTLAGGSPSRFHWLAAGAAWFLTFSISLYFFEHVYWFLGLAIANGAFLSVLNPSFALCFMMSMILMRPWEIMTGNDLMLEVPRFSMFFAFAWALLYVFAVDRFSLRWNKVFALLVAFSVWVFMSTAVTPDPGTAMAGVNETITRALMLFFLIYTLIRDEFSVWAFKVSLVTILSCVGLISVVFYFQGYTDGGRIIAFGIFKNTNDVAAVMTLLLPLAATPFLRKSGKLERLIALFPMGVATMVLALAQSRAAMLSLGLAGCVHALRKVKRKGLAVVMVTVLLGGAYAATKVFKRAEGDLEGSAESRKSFLISGMRMALYNPVFGVGFGQFPANYETYATEITHEYGKRTAHSTWVLALAETGPIGLLLFTAFFVVGAIFSGLRISAYDPSWLYAAAAYGVSMSFLSHTYMLFPYILVAGATVAAQVGVKYVAAKKAAP